MAHKVATSKDMPGKGTSSEDISSSEDDGETAYTSEENDEALAYTSGSEEINTSDMEMETQDEETQRVAASDEVLEVAASSLTYVEENSTSRLVNNQYHFVGIGIDLCNNHASKEQILEKLQSNLTKRSEEMEKKKVPMYMYYEIVRPQDLLLGCKVDNEAGVRYSYGNPIVEMLCEFFNYKLVLEDTMNDRGDIVTTSKKSKADYIIYALMKDTEGKEHAVSAVIVEAKHCKVLATSAIAQVMGYYCKSKVGNNQTGFAMLLNEFEKNIQARFFLFPYKQDVEDDGYCQSLMFPLYTCTHKELVQKRILIELILLISDVDLNIPVLSLKCPDDVKPIKSADIIGVYTDLELVERQLEREKLKRKNEKRKRKDEEREERIWKEC